MKIEDVKIGMKVVPHDKNGMFPGEGLENSYEWCRAKNIGQQYLYVNLYDGDIVICSAEKAQFNSGDYFLASDLTPYNEQYTCTVPGVTVDLIPGKEYWVSDASQENAIKYKITRKYICTVKGSHLFETEDGVHASKWNYAVDPETYEEPETEMTVEEIAEALRSKGIITGKLKIKE